MVVHVCNPGTQEVDARESGVQSQPQLHSNFMASLGYSRPCLKTKAGVGGVLWTLVACLL